MTQASQNKVFGFVRDTDTLTANTTLTVYDTGKILFLNSAAGTFDVTLPSPQAGVFFRFYLTNATADVDIVQAASGHDFSGSIMHGTGSGDFPLPTDTKIIFDQSGGAIAGDWVELHSDGVNWFVRGHASGNDALVFG